METEEAFHLVSKERYTCLVCSYHPIFDTVSMLCVHRQGKKHKSYAENAERKKQELKQLIAQRKQEQFLKYATSSINVASSCHASLGLSTVAPYDPRVRKHKAKKGGRKLQVDLQSDVTASSNQSSVSHWGNGKQLPNDPSHPSSRTSTSTNSSLWLQTAEQQMSGPIKHDHKLKNVFRGKSEDLKISPYVSKMKSDGFNSSITKQNTSGSSRCDFDLECFSESPSYSLNNKAETDVTIHRHISQSADTCLSKLSDKPFSVSLSKKSISVPHQPSSTAASVQLSQSSEVKQFKSNKRKRKDQSIFVPIKKHVHVPERGALSEKYYQLQGSGWKRDWDGKWIKDEQAEFDSDEEPPDLP